MNNWRPSASIDALKQRGQVLRTIRDFFYARDVLEVEVPLLAQHGVTDPYNDNFQCHYFNKTYYLQTSPEYHLKRLLAAGAPNIYQLAKAFRYEASGKHHNPEFTLLEWYRLDWDYHQLIDEVLALIQKVLVYQYPINKTSYQALFQKFCNIDPFNCNITALKAYASQQQIIISDSAVIDKDGWLSLIMSHTIEPQMKAEGGIYVVYDYPKSQAALAQIEGQIAKRFEVYIDGIELANGFQELTDPIAQKQRFIQDNQQRQLYGKSKMALDNYFLDALSAGMPPCSGVALGVDRLLMVKMKLANIHNVMSFTVEKA